MQSSEKSIFRETALSYSLMVVYAFFVLIIGTSLPYLLEEFGLPLSKGGLFIAVMNTGGLLGILFSDFFSTGLVNGKWRW